MIDWFSQVAVHERIQVQISSWAVVFIVTATAMYSLGHGVRTFTAVPSLPPSGDGKMNISFRLSNSNKWRWLCGWQQPTGGPTAQVGWLDLRDGGALSLHSSSEPSELTKRLWPSWHHHKNVEILLLFFCSPAQSRRCENWARRAKLKWNVCNGGYSVTIVVKRDRISFL